MKKWIKVTRVVGSTACEMRVSRGGSGVPMVKDDNKQRAAWSGGGVTWKWTFITEPRNAFLLPQDGLALVSASLENICVLLQCVWNSPFHSSSLRQRDRQRNGILLAKVGGKSSAGAHINHLLEALPFCCSERRLSKAKGQESHWFPPTVYEQASSSH